MVAYPGVKRVYRDPGSQVSTGQIESAKSGAREFLHVAMDIISAKPIAALAGLGLGDRVAGESLAAYQDAGPKPRPLIEKPAGAMSVGGPSCFIRSVRYETAYLQYLGSVEIPLSPQPSGSCCVTRATPRRFRSTDPQF
jgi:hypothetical protein